MALQTSGAISINEIHIEAGGSSGTECNISDSDIRGLINKVSGSIGFDEFYGAAAYVAPTEDAYYEMNLLGTITGANASWVNFTNSLSTYAGQKGRVVFLYTNGTSGTSFQGDLQIDNVSFDSNSYSFEGISQDWVTSTNFSTQLSFTSTTLSEFNTRIRSYPTIGIGTVGSRFNIDAGGTPSGSTGLTTASSGAYYVYAETSGSSNGYNFALSSPLIQLSASVGNLSYDLARYGGNIGTLRAYWAKNQTTDPYPPPAGVTVYGPWVATALSSVLWVNGQYSSSQYRTLYGQFGSVSTGDTCRMLVAYISGTSYTGDVQLDDFWANAQSTSAGSGQTPLYIDSSQAQQSNIITTYNSTSWTSGNGPTAAQIETVYNNTTSWSNVGSSTFYGGWQTRAGGTPSGGTGLYGLPSGTFTFFETSSVGSSYKMRLLRSKQFIATANRGFRGRVGSYGSTIGKLQIFIVKE